MSEIRFSYFTIVLSWFQVSLDPGGNDLTKSKVYNSGAIRLKGDNNTPWVVNGQRLKLYLADEQEETEVINFVTPEEAMALETVSPKSL